MSEMLGSESDCLRIFSPLPLFVASASSNLRVKLSKHLTEPHLQSHSTQPDFLTNISRKPNFSPFSASSSRYNAPGLYLFEFEPPF